MNHYTLYHHTNGTAFAVKDGWSWPALFFGFCWALNRGMVRTALVMIGLQLVVGIVLAAMLGGAPRNVLDTATLVAGLCYSLICGAWGNQWVRHHLERSGYSVAGMVQAASAQAALKLQRDGQETELLPPIDTLPAVPTRSEGSTRTA